MRCMHGACLIAVSIAHPFALKETEPALALQSFFTLRGVIRRGTGFLSQA
jgi:hypothetical protein